MSAIIRLTKRAAPEEDEVFPAWQGMQDVRDMFGGKVKLSSLDNHRYPDVGWTTLAARFRTVLEPRQ